MAQKSIHWGYLVGADSAVGYVANEDSALYGLLARSGVMVVDNGIRTLAAWANLGVFYSVANRLAVTSPANNRIDIASGAAITCGKEYYNSAAIGAAADITSPAANPRIDRVVVRANFAAASYTPANASAALFEVTTNTARVTIIHGAENAVPVAPALTQDVTRLTYWDIPLAQYQISVAGVITNLTDEREWVDAETKKIFIPAVAGWNTSLGANIYPTMYGVVLPVGNSATATTTLAIPNDFIGNGEICPVLHCINSIITNDIYITCAANYGANSESIITHTNSSGPTAHTVDLDIRYDSFNHVALTVPAVGDYIIASLERHGADGHDTYVGDCQVGGFNLNYLGWR